MTIRLILSPIVSILEINEGIFVVQNTLLSLSQSHPDHSYWIHTLATGHALRYNMSHDERDLDKAILHFTQAIFYPFHPVTKDDPNLIEAFHFLTEALLHRTFISRQLGDLKCCIVHLQYLRNLSLEAFGLKREEVTAFLVLALALQVRLESADITTNVKEMIPLCHELLTLDHLETHSTDAIRIFADLLHTHDSFELGRLPLDELIQFLRAANTRQLDSHHVPMALSDCLLMRFYATRSNDDLNDATATVDNIIATHSSSDDPSLRERASDAAFLAVKIAHARSVYFDGPDHLEESIYRERALLSTLSLEDPLRRPSIGRLTDLERKRFKDFGVINRVRHG